MVSFDYLIHVVSLCVKGRPDDAAEVMDEVFEEIFDEFREILGEYADRILVQN